jgi:hypothetical protein
MLFYSIPRLRSVCRALGNLSFGGICAQGKSMKETSMNILILKQERAPQCVARASFACVTESVRRRQLRLQLSPLLVQRLSLAHLARNKWTPGPKFDSPHQILSSFVAQPVFNLELPRVALTIDSRPHPPFLQFSPVRPGFCCRNPVSQEAVNVKG